MSTRAGRLVGALLLVGALSAGCAETGQPANSSFTGVVELRANEPVTQTFVPTTNGLTLVRVWIATYGVPGPTGTLSATLSDDSGVIREVELPGAGLSDLRAQSLVFDPVADSGGKRFELALTWTGVNRTGVLANDFDAYPDGVASSGGDLRFELGTSNRAAAVTDVVTSSITHLGRSVADDPVFWVIWSAGLVTLGWLALRRRRAADEASRQPAES